MFESLRPDQINLAHPVGIHLARVLIAGEHVRVTEPPFAVGCSDVLNREKAAALPCFSTSASFTSVSTRFASCSDTIPAWLWLASLSRYRSQISRSACAKRLLQRCLLRGTTNKANGPGGRTAPKRHARVRRSSKWLNDNEAGPLTREGS